VVRRENVEQVWDAQFVTFGKPMPRHEMWRAAYRHDRYLKALTQLELNRRFRDLVRNFLILTPDAKIGVPPISPEGIEWWVLMTHALEEFRLTYGPYPAGFTGEVHREEKFPDLAGVLAKKAASVRIPVDAGHQFRSMSGQDSGPCRATVPVDAGRGV